MKKLIIYDKKTTYMYPSGAVATPERVMKDYPAAESFTFVIETTEAQEVMYGFYPLSSLRSQYNIDSSLSVEESLLSIEKIMNVHEEASTEPTAEERIASALEYQNLMSMEDTEEVV